MDIEIISDREQLVSFLPTWASLPLSSIYQHPQWMLAWWDQFASPHMQLHVLVARDNKKNIIAMSPLYSDSQTKTLRALGDRLASDPTFPIVLAEKGLFSNGSTDELAPQQLSVDSALDCLVRSIAVQRNASRHVVSLRLSGLDPRSLANIQLLRSFEQNHFATQSSYVNHQWETHRCVGFEAAHIASEAHAESSVSNPDPYLSVPAGLTQTSTNASPPRVRVQWMLEPEDVDDWIAYVSRPDLSWISVNALSSDDAQWRFIKTIAKQFANSRNLLSLNLCHEGKILASHIGFRYARIWYSYGIFIPSSLPSSFCDTAKLVQRIDATLVNNMDRFGIDRIVSNRAMTLFLNVSSSPVPYLKLHCQIPTLLTTMKLWAQDARKNWNRWRERRKTLKSDNNRT